jgi:hypothetical protein
MMSQQKKNGSVRNIGIPQPMRKGNSNAQATVDPKYARMKIAIRTTVNLGGFVVASWAHPGC